MKILYAVSEAAPFCKMGGLADVAGSLPPALAQGGESVAVILPLHAQIGGEWREKMTFRRYIYVDVGWRHQYCGLFSMDYQGVTWYFVDNEYYFRRKGLYAEHDDGERYAFFCRAVLALLPLLDERPEVIHCNDWQTALICVYLRDFACRDERLRGIRTVFTIHNIAYQGIMPADTVEDVLGLDRGWYEDGTIAMDGAVNLMKAGLMTAHEITTVSPTYAHELHYAYYAHRMESVIARLEGHLTGILNGLDTESYDPAADASLPARYAPENMDGKRGCKEALQRQLGLAAQQDTPLIAIVSRLVEHKGLDLVCAVFDDIMACDVQLVILGVGEAKYEVFFRRQQQRYQGRVAACITHSESLARQIYGGSDLLLMPSKSEPCGLSQMIAMRYGTVPIVRQTGGLNDSVQSCQVGQEGGNGFVFADYNAFDMLHVIREAVSLYRNDKQGFSLVQHRGMTADFGWAASAEAYRAVYHKQ